MTREFFTPVGRRDDSIVTLANVASLEEARTVLAGLVSGGMLTGGYVEHHVVEVIAQINGAATSRKRGSRKPAPAPTPPPPKAAKKVSKVAVKPQPAVSSPSANPAGNDLVTKNRDGNWTLRVPTWWTISKRRWFEMQAAGIFANVPGTRDGIYHCNAKDAEGVKLLKAEAKTAAPYIARRAAKG
jgi:hypothetical protein